MERYDNYFQLITDTILNPTLELCTKERLKDSRNGVEQYTIENGKDDAIVIKKGNSEFEIILPGKYRIRNLNDEYGGIIQFFLPDNITEMARFSDKSTHIESFDMAKRINGLVDIIPIGENGIKDTDLDDYLKSMQRTDFLGAYRKYREYLSIERESSGVMSNMRYDNSVSNNSRGWIDSQENNEAGQEVDSSSQGMVVGMPKGLNNVVSALCTILNNKEMEKSALQEQFLKNSRTGERKLPEDKQ